jgi:hypothetical protein
MPGVDEVCGPWCARRSRSPFASLFLGVIALLAVAAAMPATASAVVRIKDDHGGNIGEYWSRFTALRDSGDRVMIDGICSSACTLVLGLVPSERICVTKNASLGFHAAWRPGLLGAQVINEPATRTLMSSYPAPIRQWVARNGGLNTWTIYLSGPDLMALYPQCR